MKGLSYVFRSENLQVFVYIYALIKYIRKTRKSNWVLVNAAEFLLKLLLTLVFSVVIFVLLLIFAVYYELVNLVLKCKHGKNYAGIFEGLDAIWAIEEESKSIAYSLYLIEVKEGQDHRHVHKFFTESHRDLCETQMKLSCVRKRYMGYNYYLKTTIEIENFVTYIDDYVDEDGLKLLLDNYNNSDFPLDNCGTWDIRVGTTAINWKKCEKKVYPVLSRYHHSVGDGVTLLAVMMSNLTADGLDMLKDQFDVYEALMKKNSDKTLVQKIETAYNKNCYVKHVRRLVPKEHSILHGQKISGDKFFCWALEQENDKYVDKVKEIKNRFQAVSFSDVVITALSASLTEYYKKHDKTPPKSVRSALTMDFSTPQLNKKITYIQGRPVVNLTNDFSAGVINIPIIDEAIGDNLIDRLFAVNKETELLKKAVDFPFAYWTMKIAASVIPMPFLQWLMGSDITLVMTNVLGLKMITLLNGHVIRDIIAGTGNYAAQGISVVIFSYDNLIRIAATVDKAVIPNREEVDEILNNIFKYIDRLDLSTKNL